MIMFTYILSKQKTFSTPLFLAETFDDCFLIKGFCSQMCHQSMLRTFIIIVIYYKQIRIIINQFVTVCFRQIFICSTTWAKSRFSLELPVRMGMTVSALKKGAFECLYYFISASLYKQIIYQDFMLSWIINVNNNWWLNFVCVDLVNQPRKQILG